jgi:hypothetical protein
MRGALNSNSILQLKYDSKRGQPVFIVYNAKCFVWNCTPLLNGCKTPCLGVHIMIEIIGLSDQLNPLKHKLVINNSLKFVSAFTGYTPRLRYKDQLVHSVS